jgi:hypothetical protein
LTRCTQTLMNLVNGEAILVEIKREFVHEVETDAGDDGQWPVCELGLLEEVLDFITVVEVALADLASADGSLGVLDVLESTSGS